jgi:hypothetical protein
MVHTNEIIIEGSHSAGWQFMNAERVPFRGPCPEDSGDHYWNDICEVNEANGIYIDHKTAVTRWCGERMDYDLAVYALGTRVKYFRRQAESVSAETSD